MIGVKLASSRTARCILLGLATVSAAVLITTDSADARRRHSKHRHHHAQRSSYNPPFASLIVDANTGATLQATNADASRHPASLTKVMTLYMLFERLESGKITLDSTMEVSAHAAAQAPTKLGLRPGQTIRVEDAIKGMVTRSANDAAVVVAEALGGSEDEFCKIMTRKARALGMSKTTYVNASGLPDDGQVTTARDQALLGRAIQDRFPRYYRYFATKAFTFRGRTIRGHNRLLGSVDGVDGIKTGYTRDSGFNLLTSIKRGNRYLVGVVLGGRSGASRDATMRKLLAEHLDDGATRRTVAAITERNMPREVAEATAREDAAAKTRVKPEPAPMVQVQGAVQLASAVPDPVPVPAPRAPAAPAQSQAEQKPAPAPLTSGVISSPMSIVPGSEEPMTPVRVRTVHVRMGGTKVASAAPTAQAVTGALPIRAPEPAAKPQVQPVRTGAAAPQVRFPAPLPTPISHQSPGLGQGTVGPPPTQPLPAPRTTMAYADPNRGTPPSTLGAQARALEAPAPAQEQASQTPAPATETIQHNGAIKATARSGWIIQVGALDSESEARRRLETAQETARKLLGSADPFTETVTVAKGRKTLYRARFAGLDQNSAEAACRKLKRSDIGCITIRN